MPEHLRQGRDPFSLQRRLAQGRGNNITRGQPWAVLEHIIGHRLGCKPARNGKLSTFMGHQGHFTRNRMINQELIPDSLNS